MDYTVKVMNRFKGLDLMPEELWREVHNIVQEAVTKTIPKKKKSKKAKLVYTLPQIFHGLHHFQSSNRQMVPTHTFSLSLPHSSSSLSSLPPSLSKTWFRNQHSRIKKLECY